MRVLGLAEDTLKVLLPYPPLHINMSSPFYPPSLSFCVWTDWEHLLNNLWRQQAKQTVLGSTAHAMNYL